MPVAEGVTLDHVARETSDMSRFINFYQELFGFEETASFEIEGTNVKWLYLAGVYTMHVIQRKTKSQLSMPHSPPPIVEFADLPSARHFCFTLSNFDFFIQTLKVIYWKSRAPPVDGEKSQLA
ncbi:hypothetical protein AB3S75_046615 [Citrus x aurantiifolia]